MGTWPPLSFSSSSHCCSYQRERRSRRKEVTVGWARWRKRGGGWAIQKERRGGACSQKQKGEREKEETAVLPPYLSASISHEGGGGGEEGPASLENRRNEQYILLYTAHLYLYHTEGRREVQHAPTFSFVCGGQHNMERGRCAFLAEQLLFCPTVPPPPSPISSKLIPTPFPFLSHGGKHVRRRRTSGYREGWREALACCSGTLLRPFPVSLFWYQCNQRGRGEERRGESRGTWRHVASSSSPFGRGLCQMRLFGSQGEPESKRG